MESIVIVSMVVLGGMGNIYGVIVGAVLLYAIPEILRLTARQLQEFFGTEVVPTEALRMLLFGISLVAIMLFKPMGLFPKNKMENNKNILSVKNAKTFWRSDRY